MERKAIAYDPSVVYTVDDLARYWRVEPSTVYTLIRSGRLAAFKVGVGWRITDKAVREFEEGESA